jgi:predicted glycoside hydrolase/deacetylase ChbG (UPF0249 family)
MIRRVIVNADDLGASIGVDAGIAEAIERGTVTSASLMVNMPDAAGGAALARDHPDVSVGLHVNVTFEGGGPIVDLDDPRAFRTELLRQVDEFTRLVGGPPTHLDAHHNIHRDERLTPLFVEVARALAVPLRENGPVTYFPSFYGRWDDTTHPEHIGVDNLVHMVSAFGPGPTELACHPGRPEPDFESDYRDERLIELHTLLDPSLPGRLRDLGVELISYHDVRRVPRSGGS